MENEISNVQVDTRGETSARVVIEVPLEEADANEHVILGKAWAILAERITVAKREYSEETAPAEDAAPAAPGNAACVVGWLSRVLA